MKILATYTPRGSWSSYEESWYAGVAFEPSWIYFRLFGYEISLYR